MGPVPCQGTRDSGFRLRDSVESQLMKLAFSSNAFRNWSIEETIGILAGIGYQGLELMADRPHAWPEDMTPDRIDSIRKALDQHKMQVSNVNAFMMCAYKDPKSGAHFVWNTNKRNKRGTLGVAEPFE